MEIPDIQYKLNFKDFNDTYFQFSKEQKKRILWIKYFEIVNKFFVYEYSFLEFCNDIFEIDYNTLK